jgi:DNA gyrase/topoisomerase IV subunit A
METISIGGGRQSRNAIVVTEMPYQVNKVRARRLSSN